MKDPFSFEVTALPSMPKNELWLVPSSLPYPMTRDEAAAWMRAHSVKITNLEVSLTPDVSSKP